MFHLKPANSEVGVMYLVSLLLGALFAGGLIVASLVMPTSDPQDGFFYPILTLMMDSSYL